MDLFLMNGHLNGIEDKGVESFYFEGVGQWQYVSDFIANWQRYWNIDNNTFDNRVGNRSIKNSFNVDNSNQNQYIQIMSAYISGDNQNHTFSIQNVDDLCLVYVNDVLILSCDYWSNTGGADKGQKQSNTVFLKSGQNHIVLVYINRGGASVCNFRIDGNNTDTYTWYLYSGGIAKEQQIKAQQTADEQARIKAEQDAINAKQAEQDKINQQLELEKIRLKQLELGGKVGGTSASLGPQNNSLLLYGGIGVVVLGVLALFVFKKKKRK